jgi:aryl-alcohol dehydrogenase-like predicted oxidoreductase
MIRRELGNTGLQVSAIGVGLAALGRPGYINLSHAEDLGHDYAVEAMRAQAHEVLDAAWEAGIRYFDAARSYGRAEEFLSSWLNARDRQPGQVTVGSKWGYTYVAGWQVETEQHEIKEHSLPVLQRQTRESRALLDPFLKLYQIHSATLDSGVLDNSDVLTELARLRDEGLVMGLSLSGAGQAETLLKAMEVHVDGRRLFGCVQATWNLLEVSAGPVLAEAHDAGMGVIIKEALANGRLTARNSDPEFREQLELLSNLAEERQTTVDALALAGVLAQPWVDVALSGAVTVAQLNSNVQAVRAQWDEEAARQSAALVEEPAAYWRKRSSLAWN